jgi:predicted dinucleotide-binding enzyme
MRSLKIGVLGTGDVGRVLGKGLAALGHEVKLGSRDAANEKVRAWVADAGAKASGGTFADAARHGEVVLLATLWSGTESALRLAGGPAAFAGKVVVDATNPLDFSQGVPPRLTHALTDSGGEQVQRWLPGAKVVKAFNSVGNALMVNPRLPGGPPDMFVAGDDAGAKALVSELCAALGWATVDAGGIEGSRDLEALAMVWIHHGFRTNTWTHAFKLLRK